MSYDKQGERVHYSTDGILTAPTLDRKTVVSYTSLIKWNLDQATYIVNGVLSSNVSKEFMQRGKIPAYNGYRFEYNKESSILRLVDYDMEIGRFSSNVVGVLRNYFPIETKQPETEKLEKIVNAA